MMLLKFCVIILMVFLKIILLCDANEESQGNSATNCFTMPFNINTKKLKRYKSKLSSINKGNLTANRKLLSGYKNRFLTENFVLTCDGHILSLFRLSYQNTVEGPRKCPVLLVHGLFQSSDVFLQQNERQNLAAKLQDLGYDVWVTNLRGNKYNRVHIVLELDTDEKNDFFNYGYEEMAFHDISSTVNFILKATQVEKLVYIGHSLGGTVFLVLNSLFPEYNSKFAKAYLLGPLGYHKHFPNRDLKLSAKNAEEIRRSLFEKGTLEIFPYTNENVSFSAEDCLGNKSYQYICNQINIKNIMGTSAYFQGLNSDNNTIVQTRGGAIGPLLHLAQNVNSGRFSQWDYGVLGNKKVYGTSEPPKFDLGLVTVPTKIIYSMSDEFVSPEDLRQMAKDMANAETRQVAKTDFAHEDFVRGSDVMQNVYAGIIDELEQNPDMCRELPTDGLLKQIFMDQLWIWISILLVIILAVIALCLLLCKKEEEVEDHCAVYAIYGH